MQHLDNLPAREHGFVIALYYGTAKRPLCRVIPDSKYPKMYRIEWPDGTLSDMVNLSRAKDAAMVLAMRQLPTGNSKPLHWKQDRVQDDRQAG